MFYRDIFLQIIQSLWLSKGKMLSGCAIGHPGPSRVPLLVIYKIIIRVFTALRSYLQLLLSDKDTKYADSHGHKVQTGSRTHSKHLDLNAVQLTVGHCHLFHCGTIEALTSQQIFNNEWKLKPHAASIVTKLTQSSTNGMALFPAHITLHL
jgi:hypothetical protein